MSIVSVVITTYNRPQKLIRAIESVRNQSFKCTELIVVDDGSDQPVSDMLSDEYRHCIKIIRHNKNCGVQKARNTGLEKATGEFIAFLDDDDYWHDDKIEKQVAVFSQSTNDVGLVYCGFTYVNEGVTCARYYPSLKGDIFHRLLRRNFVGSTSIPLIRMSAIKAVGCFDESLKSFQDWDMWLRILEKYRADYVNDLLVVREAHGDQITSDIVRKIEGREYFIKKYSSHLSMNKAYLAHHYRVLSDNYFLAENIGEGKRYCWKSFVVDPFSYSSIVNLLLLFLPNPLRGRLIMERRTQHVGNIRFYR